MVSTWQNFCTEIYSYNFFELLVIRSSWFLSMKFLCCYSGFGLDIYIAWIISKAILLLLLLFSWSAMSCVWRRKQEAQLVIFAITLVEGDVWKLLSIHLQFVGACTVLQEPSQINLILIFWFNSGCLLRTELEPSDKCYLIFWREWIATFRCCLYVAIVISFCVLSSSSYFKVLKSDSCFQFSAMFNLYCWLLISLISYWIMTSKYLNDHFCLELTLYTLVYVFLFFEDKW